MNTNTTVTAPDITCGGCAASIKKALGRVDGVTDVEVDVESKQVSVSHAEQITRDDVIQALDRAGFPAQ